MLARILVYANSGSRADPAAEQAGWIADRTGAELTLVDVVGELPALPPHSSDLGDLIRERKNERLEFLAARQSEKGLRVETRLLSGRPAVAVGQHVLDEGHDLLLLGAERAEERRALRVARRLLRICPCPVWIVRGSRRGPPKHILAAVEPAPKATDEAALNGVVMTYASSLAELGGGEVRIVSSWYHGEDDVEPYLPKDSYEAFERALEENARDLLDDFLGSLVPRPADDRVHLVRRNPADAVVELAERHGADLVVLGTFGRRGLAGLLLGNTAEAVLRLAPCSLLAVKPDGFVSPLSGA